MKAWYSLKEKGSGLGMRTMMLIMRTMGYRFSRLFLNFIALYYTLFMPRVRLWLVQFHLRATGKSSFWTVFRTIRNFAESMMDRVYVMMGRDDLFTLKVHNPEPVMDLHRQGKGALLLGAHLGPLEVSRIWPEGRELPINVLIHSAISPTLYRELKKVDPDVERRMIQVGDDFVSMTLRVKERLEAGEFVAILGDRPGLYGDTVELPFLGEKTRFPLGPYAIALALQHPVILTFIAKTGPRAYELFIEELSDANDAKKVPRAERRAHMARLAQAYVSRLESYCQRYPTQWYNFYDYWGD